MVYLVLDQKFFLFNFFLLYFKSDIITYCNFVLNFWETLRGITVMTWGS